MLEIFHYTEERNTNLRCSAAFCLLLFCLSLPREMLFLKNRVALTGALFTSKQMTSFYSWGYFNEPNFLTH